MKKGDQYKGFEVLDTVDVDECQGKGIYLKHKESGLEIFHILNEDPENLCAFAFNTPADSKTFSTGVAHIIEHSVLCGSSKYPCKDPFLRLSQQSVNTYLNAYTSSDRTVFPVSSILKKDYYNLVSVYADAVFFPLLKKEVFLQEGWRIESSGDGKNEIQGVVYNEMKGNYASFDRVASSIIRNAVVEGTVYAGDSGGDPLCIPELSYEDFVEFHKKHYCTANCFIFLCGNIPTEEQLDFFADNIISKVSDYGEKCTDIFKEKPESLKSYIKAYAPSDDENSAHKPNTAAIIWRTTENAEKEDLRLLPIEEIFVCDLLFGEDCAPVSKMLLEKFPDCDISPHTGPDVFTRIHSLCIAMRGCSEETAKEIEQAVFEKLESICKEGIPEDDIERTVLNFEFSNREVKRAVYGGPYSLVLLRRILRTKTYDAVPWAALNFRKSFQEVKNRIHSEPEYLVSLIRKFLLDNPNHSLVYVEPSSKWTQERNEAESQLCSKLAEKLGCERIASDKKALEEFQNYDDSAVEIPRVDISELEKIQDTIRLDEKTIGTVPYFESLEPTNGIIYASIGFPADVLKAEDYKYMALMEECISEMGWSDKSWSEAAAERNKILGGLGAFTRSSSVPECSLHLVKERPLIIGRDWFIIHFRMLEEMADSGFDYINELIQKLDFNDTKRLSTLINGIYSSYASQIVPEAHLYAMQRATRTVSRAAAANEKLNGLKAFFDMGEIKSRNVEEISVKLTELFGKLKSSGCFFHATAEKNGLELAEKKFAGMVNANGLAAPVAGCNQGLEEFIAVTEIEGDIKESSSAADEVYIIPGAVGFSASARECASFDTKESMEDEVLAHLLKSTDLWHQIRTVNGAYGVFMSVNSDSKVARFITFRDPKPFDSLKFFNSRMKSLNQEKFSKEEIEKTISGVYADEVSPDYPAARGSAGLTRFLYGYTGKMRERRVDWLLSLTVQDIERAASRFSGAKEKGIKVVICGKDMISGDFENNCGKIIRLSL